MMKKLFILFYLLLNVLSVCLAEGSYTSFDYDGDLFYQHPYFWDGIDYYKEPTALYHSTGTWTAEQFFSGATISGVLDMDNNKIINLSTPTDDLDAVNKSYCDSNTGSSVTEYIWGFNYNRDISPFLVHTSSTVSTDAWEFNSNYDIQLKLSALADNAWGVDGNDDLYPK